MWSRHSPLAKARKNVTDMIRRHVPRFDDYTDKEQIDFIVRTQDKVNKIRESVEALILPLEYAAPDKPNAVPPHKDPRADVQAAVFSAVMGGTRRAGELLDLPLPHSDADRHENQTVRKMANRGRELLRMHFGETEWKNMVERMRVYREWWEWYESVDDPKDQVYALLAKASGTSAEHERASAEEDGFDAILEEWIPVAEQRINVMDALDKCKDASEKDNLSREAKRLLDLQMSIEERDERFSRALSLFDAPSSDRP